MMLAKDFLDGKYFGIFISVLIFYSLVTFSMETLPDLDESTLVFQLEKLAQQLMLVNAALSLP
jgi:hypothetical protein